MNAPDLFLARNSAKISPCGTFRYRLTRALGPSVRIANFVMLNPSKADAERNDPTTTRCMGFAEDWGCGELVLSNLFAFRATKPIDLLAAADPIGPKNSDYIIGAACRAHESGGVVVAAWGTHGGFRDQERHVMSLLTQTLGIPVQCLGVTAEGFPRHPLYLAKETALVPFNGRPLKGV